MNWTDILRSEALEEGRWKIVQAGRASVGILLRKGELFAVRNHCPHAGAEICRGRVTGRVLVADNEQITYDPDALTLRCPWHHWEFDLRDGRPVVDMPGRLQVFAVKIEAGRVWLGPPARPPGAPR